MNKNKKYVAAAGALALAAMGATAQAQSSDALIDKLVDKGILTTKEANDLREEADKDFTKAYSVKSGLPEWVNGMKFNGDFRGRYEGFYIADPKAATGVDRHRFRYRLRFGFTAMMMDNMEVGFALTSSEPSGAFGGDPVSGNTTLGNGADKKFVYIDKAYAKWSPLNSPDATAAFTFGKMENPFVYPSTILFDRDYTPEGLATELSYNVTADQKLRLIGAGYVLDENGGTSQDPFLLAGQLRLESKWTPKISSTVGVGWFSVLSGKPSLTTAAVPNQGRGNTRNAAGNLVYTYNPIYADAGATYLLDKFPGYAGAFPITLSADYLYNPAVKELNTGYSIGMILGKSGKKGLWDVTYRWTELQKDAWYEEFVESDFGAYYKAAPTGGSAGYQSGTNVRGHWIKASYSPYDSLTLSAACFLTGLVTENPRGSRSGATRFQVDAVWKF